MPLQKKQIKKAKVPMSEFNKKTIKAATLHFPIFVEGVGNVEKVLSSTASAIHKPAKMTLDEPFVRIEFSGKSGATVVAAVPIESFTHLVMESAPAPLPKPLRE